MAARPWATLGLGLVAVTLLALLSLEVLLGKKSAMDLSLLYAWVAIVPMVV